MSLQTPSNKSKTTTCTPPKKQNEEKAGTNNHQNTSAIVSKMQNLEKHPTTIQIKDQFKKWTKTNGKDQGRNKACDL